MSPGAKGRLEVVCGSMFSGKTEELIRRLIRAELAQMRVITFKHSLDKRSEIEFLSSHNGRKFKAVPVTDPSQLLDFVESNYEIIGIDEVQFFTNDIINVICKLVDSGKRVLVAGLDLDFRGMPFGCVPTLMAIADKVTKLQAICMCCGKDAHYTQRMVNGKPAHHNEPQILVGAQESYQARCRSCHTIDEPPTF